MIPAELAAIYARVPYWVTPEQGPPFVLRVGASSVELDALLRERGVTAWAFLSAHNPLSQKARPADNARQQAALCAELREADYELVPAYGEGLEGWPDEASVLVLGIESEAARAFALRYRQAAFLAGRIGEAVRLAPGLS